jgi:hypothetical protein
MSLPLLLKESDVIINAGEPMKDGQGKKQNKGTSFLPDFIRPSRPPHFACPLPSFSLLSLSFLFLSNRTIGLSVCLPPLPFSSPSFLTWQSGYNVPHVKKLTRVQITLREGKGREGKGREGKGREGKDRQENKGQ